MHNFIANGLNQASQKKDDCINKFIFEKKSERKASPFYLSQTEINSIYYNNTPQSKQDRAEK